MCRMLSVTHNSMQGVIRCSAYRQNKILSLFSQGFAAVSAPDDILVRGDSAAPHLPKDQARTLHRDSSSKKLSYRSSILTSALVWRKVSHLCYHVHQKEFLIICSYVLMPEKFNKDTEQYNYLRKENNESLVAFK